MENDQVSAGTLEAARQRGIRIPDQLKLVGIDAVPGDALRNTSLTQIGVPHAGRASLAFALLREMMVSDCQIQGRILGIPFRIPG